MKLRMLGRHIKEGLKNLGRNGWMTFASVSAVTVSLLLVGLFMMVILNLNSMANQVKDDVEIHAFIDVTANSSDEKHLKEQIKQIDQVQSIQYQTNQEGLNNLALGDETKSYVKSLDNIGFLPNYYVVKTENPEQVPKVAKEIKQFNHVGDLKYGQGKVEKLFSVVDIAKSVGLVLVVGLLFTSIFLITNTIKLTIVARRTEIEIMKLVGATNAFVRWPFFMEGLFLGILGAVLPIAAVAVGYQYVYQHFNDRMMAMFEMIPYQDLVMMLGSILLVLGALIGVLGSMQSVRKFLSV